MEILRHLRAQTDTNLCIKYLEAVVESGSTVPQFHNELVLIYLEDILALQREQQNNRLSTTSKASSSSSSSSSSSLSSGASAQGGVIDEAGGVNINGVARERGPSAETDSTREHSKSLGASRYGVGRVGIVRQSLIRFLSQSVYYEPTKLLSHFPRDCLLEERALLLSRCGNHAEVLDIFVRDLHDYDAAEAYCNQVYNTNKNEQNIYLHLLSIYLSNNKTNSSSSSSSTAGSSSVTSSSSSSSSANSAASMAGAHSNSNAGGKGSHHSADSAMTPELVAATGLLSRCYDRVNPVEALRMIPDTAPVRLIERFVSLVISRNLVEMRNNQVIKNLYKAENLRTKLTLHEENRVRIVIDRDTICHSCGKKVGMAAFTVSPQKHIYHYMCYNSTIVGSRESHSTSHHM